MGIGRFRDRLCDAIFAARHEEAMRDYRHRPATQHLSPAKESGLRKVDHGSTAHAVSAKEGAARAGTGSAP